MTTAKDLKLSFPEPCSEVWENMAPNGCNRHCAVCDKTIHDLSKLTIDQAEELLDCDEEVCVRAEIRPGGKIAHAAAQRPVPQHPALRRQMIAVVGASITLATAACQTIPAEDRPNRFEISGTLPYHQKPIVRSSDGQTWKVDVEWRGTSFRVLNLFPGTYSITYQQNCGLGELVIEDVVIQDESVDLGRLDSDVCIIVGLMKRVDTRHSG